MELNKGHIFFGAACLIAGIVLGAGFRSCSSKPAEPAMPPKVIHDTVTVHDTLRIKEHTKPKEVLRHDTIWLPDTTSKTTSSTTKDTTSKDADFALVPITQYEYRDTFTTDSSRIELGVRFSGWHAQIDSIDLNSQYTIQPRTIEKKKGWGQFVGFGVGIGYGVSFTKNQYSAGTVVNAAPEIGVHLVYGWGYHW